MKKLPVAILTVLLALLLGACSGEKKPKKDPKVYGVMHVNKNEEIIFKNEPTPIEGACSGWNKVVVQVPKQPDTANDSRFCWRADEKKKIFYTNTRQGYEKELPLHYIKERLNKFPRDYKA